MEVGVINASFFGLPITPKRRDWSFAPRWKKSQQLVFKALEVRQRFLPELTTKQAADKKVILTDVGKGSAKTSDFIHIVGGVN